MFFLFCSLVIVTHWLCLSSLSRQENYGVGPSFSGGDEVEKMGRTSVRQLFQKKYGERKTVGRHFWMVLVTIKPRMAHQEARRGGGSASSQFASRRPLPIANDIIHLSAYNQVLFLSSSFLLFNVSLIVFSFFLLSFILLQESTYV